MERVSEVCIERQEWRGFQRLIERQERRGFQIYELKGRSGEVDVEQVKDGRF